MVKKVLRCAIYIRVSTAEQAMHGKSLEAQLSYLTQYAKDHDMVVAGVYADQGKTARKNLRDRKEIKNLLSSVKRNEIDVIIFWKMDRWFRNVGDFYKVQDILDAHGARWIATAEPNMNMETREGRLNVNIMLSINQNETDTTSERICFVNEASVRLGKAISGAQPYGYKVVRNESGAKVVVKDPERELYVEEFFRHFLVHQSKRGAFLYLTEKYGPVITMSQVITMCKNTMYFGAYRENPNYCPAYITFDQYIQIREINRKNIKVYQSNLGTGEVYLFCGLIHCPICGRPMSANRITKNSHTGKPLKDPLRYYRCQNWCYKKSCTYSKIASEATIEKYLLGHIDEEKERYRQREEILLTRISAQAPVEKKKPSKEKLLAELDRLNNMYQKGRISDEKYDSEYERISSDIKAMSIETLPVPKRSYKELETVLHSGWHEMYEHLSRQNKQAFWRSIIKEIHLNTDNSFVNFIDFL
ncbi:recombinase family protein [Enterocloster lavalensis]|uniref:recombinase family protein n=1 Tax=Enterocloster lavalensis TaxID=460384 RepID=UPI002666A9EA|nr:recombinase family protein [Enterocloster lavalensis]